MTFCFMMKKDHFKQKLLLWPLVPLRGVPWKIVVSRFKTIKKPIYKFSRILEKSIKGVFFSKGASFLAETWLTDELLNRYFSITCLLLGSVYFKEQLWRTTYGCCCYFYFTIVKLCFCENYKTFFQKRNKSFLKKKNCR